MNNTTTFVLLSSWIYCIFIVLALLGTSVAKVQPPTNMGKIIFYEDRNFGGRYHECMGDCADLHSYFNRCHSVKVESGYFMVYDRPSYMGCQYFLKRSKYPDYMRMMGMNDCIRSCRMNPMHHGTFRMRLDERSDMSGRMMELMDDCPNLMDRFHMSDFQSCHVMDGQWLAYEQPNYIGRHFCLRPGEYRRYSDWGGMSSRMGSIRQIRGPLKKGVLVKRLLYALFHTLNKLVSVLKCVQFCSCSLHLEASLPDEDTYYKLPDYISLFGELNKTIKTFSLITTVVECSLCL